MFHTPDDVLERTYRRAVEYADAMGISLDAAMKQFDVATAAELREYVERVYG